MTDQTTSGRCLCGNIHITLSGKPKFSVLCYCKDCQRISGAGNLPQAAIQEKNLEISGSLKSFQWQSDAGNDVTLGYCGECGSPIYKTTSKLPGFYFVPVGLLHDQSVFSNPNLAYADNCQAWDTLPKKP